MDLKKMVTSANNEVLQAVIFAESFDAKFGPLTYSKPKILIPLVNRPVFDYTIEMLARSGIQDVFIFCNQNNDQLKEYIKQCKAKLFNKMNIQMFISEEYTNMGAAIRDLDAKGIIKYNFVLINGDCVGNLKLDELIDTHKKNIQKDPHCVMTSIFRKVNSNHRIRSIENEVVLFLDSKKKIVFFEKVSINKSVEVPMKLFENKSVSIHYDLLDTHVSICSNKVPPDFSDNFDFENREDFINGLLAEDELLQHYIYAHILRDGYASRISSISTYDSISRDIIQRFVYPIVPDLQDDCSYRRNNVYLQDNVKVESKSKICQNVAIGTKTSIDEDCLISDSVIGAHCDIGKNVTIKNSYIWDNVKIGENSKIEKSIIASNVTIRNDCVIDSGCILSNDVVIDSGVYLETSKFIINDPDIDSDKNLVGINGIGSLFVKEEDEDLETEIEDIWGKEKKNDDISDISTNFSDSSDDRCDSPADEFKSFFNEVYDSLQRGIEERLIAENLILEINSSKHAYNVPMKEVNSIVIKAILKLAQQEDKELFIALKDCMQYMLPLIKNYIRSDESQNDCIYSIEEYYLSNMDIVKPVVFVKIIQYLYNENILDEELILSWYFKPNSLPDHEIEDQKELRSQKEVKLFINWLKEAEEESPSDSDD